jgi:uncharacterized protein (TIGR02594 family)
MNKRNLFLALQTRLAALGYYRLRVDGVWGSGSRRALETFARASGLHVTDTNTTLRGLFGDDAKPLDATALPGRYNRDPAWLAAARQLLGVTETPGAANNPQIMRWAQDLDQWYPGDDVAWCGLFVAHCMSVGAPDVPQSFNRLGARAWKDFGVPIAATEVAPYGAVCRLWRTHPTKSWHGHVFIVTAQSDDAICGIGGNQDDSVSERWFSRERVLGYNMPYAMDQYKPAPRSKTGTLSHNEA